MKKTGILGALLLVAVLAPAISLILRTDASGQLRPAYNFQPWPSHPEDVVNIDTRVSVIAKSYAPIYTVPPGHYAIAQNGEVSVYPYWDLEFPTAEALRRDDRSDEEVTAGFRDVLEDAVRERLVADVEVASYLSGGIDSCAVLGLAQQMMDRPIRSFNSRIDSCAFIRSLALWSDCPISLTTNICCAHRMGYGQR